ncbi:MAG: hypothetical protein WA924_04410, partial [Burkholderiaceae bacterium]
MEINAPMREKAWRHRRQAVILRSAGLNRQECFLNGRSVPRLAVIAMQQSIATYTPSIALC